MKVFLLLATIVVAIQAISLDDHLEDVWLAYKAEYNKIYKNQEEDNLRKKILQHNRDIVAEHNNQFENGINSFKLKINQFSDMLLDEFVKKFNGFNISIDINLRAGHNFVRVPFIEPSNNSLPKSVDWRQHGYVTEVKYQTHYCGACWAFSTTGALEGQLFKKTGALVSLSEQNLIDCSRAYGNNGCEGGLVDSAFQYVKDNRGLDFEAYYPYEARDNYCSIEIIEYGTRVLRNVNIEIRYIPNYSRAFDVEYVEIPQGDEQKLMIAVATVGPVSVAIDASHQTFQHYSNGIYYDPECSYRLDHAVLIVGYGTEQDAYGNLEDYWLVKNSWGPLWGKNGYIKMARNRNNHCGIASSASYPLV